MEGGEDPNAVVEPHFPPVNDCDDARASAVVRRAIFSWRAMLGSSV
jgi:hypothetical protein